MQQYLQKVNKKRDMKVSLFLYSTLTEASGEPE